MLETSRLILRVPWIEDAPFLYEMNLDPEVVRYTGDVAFTSVEEAKKLILERNAHQWERFKMVRFSVFSKEGTYLGWNGLKFHPETNEVDLGYRFYKKYWGQGFASESSLAVLEYGFETLNLNLIIGKAMPENVSSIKVLQKIGMTFKGYVHDPTDPHPFIRFEIKQSEFKSCATL